MAKGGKREGAGRKRIGKDLMKRVTIRISPDTHNKLKKIAGYNAIIRKFLEAL